MVSCGSSWVFSDQFPVKKKISAIVYYLRFLVALSYQLQLSNFFELRNVVSAEERVSKWNACSLVITGDLFFLILILSQPSFQITHQKRWSHIFFQKCAKVKRNKGDQDLYKGDHEMFSQMQIFFSWPTVKPFCSMSF